MSQSQRVRASHACVGRQSDEHLEEVAYVWVLHSGSYASAVPGPYGSAELLLRR